VRRFGDGHVGMVSKEDQATVNTVGPQVP